MDCKPSVPRKSISWCYLNVLCQVERNCVRMSVFLIGSVFQDQIYWALHKNSVVLM